MNGLIYYLRLRGDTVYIESDVTDAKVEELEGFIRRTPEIKFAGENGDVTVEYIAGLKDECGDWPISEEQKVKFKEDADKWIAKRKK